MPFEDPDTLRIMSYKASDHVLTGILYMSGRWGEISDSFLKALSDGKFNKHHKALIYATLMKKQIYLRKSTEIDQDSEELHSVWNDDGIDPLDKILLYVEDKIERDKTHGLWEEMKEYWEYVRNIEPRKRALLVPMGCHSVDVEDKVIEKRKNGKKVVVGVDKRDDETYWFVPTDPSSMNIPTLSRILQESGKADETYIMFYDGKFMPFVICPEKVEYTNLYHGDELPFSTRYKSLWARFSTHDFEPESMMPDGLKHISHSFHSNYFFQTKEAALDFERSELDMIDRAGFKTEEVFADELLRDEDGEFFDGLYKIKGITEEDLDKFDWKRRLSLAKSIDMHFLNEQLRTVLKRAVSDEVIILADSDVRDVFKKCAGSKKTKLISPERRTAQQNRDYSLYGIMENKRLHKLFKYLNPRVYRKKYLSRSK